MTKVVISQPMFFPWIGILEQMRQADVFVHYDDALLPRGRSFCSRVQIRSDAGTQWLSVPVKRGGDQPIKDVLTDECQRWRERARGMLTRCYGRAPFRREMYELFDRVLQSQTDSLGEICIASIEGLAEYFGLSPRFLRSSEVGGIGRGTERLVSIVSGLGGRVYITGHGAKNYLDHEMFENAGIKVEYMNYLRVPYPQIHGSFDPHTSALDLVANAGRSGEKYICSGTLNWKEFIK